jgi:hypothetical protein
MDAIRNVSVSIAAIPEICAEWESEPDLHIMI